MIKRGLSVFLQGSTLAHGVRVAQQLKSAAVIPLDGVCVSLVMHECVRGSKVAQGYCNHHAKGGIVYLPLKLYPSRALKAAFNPL